MYEHRKEPLISRQAFIRRLVSWLIITLLFMMLSLLIGVAGYHYFESLPWLDAFLNAAMILGGMGEIDPLQTPEGKFFAACYALYGGIFMIVCGGLLLAPVFHRILHHFHQEGE